MATDTLNMSKPMSRFFGRRPTPSAQADDDDEGDHIGADSPL